MLDANDPLRFVGTLINDRYRIESPLGRGSMGDVYEVEDLSSGRRGALKLLLADVGKNAQIAGRLVREGKAMGMFAHPNIVELLDVGVLEDGRPFLVTELVRGLSLRAVLDHGRVEPLRALAIVRQVLEALAHAHRHGVIHRDIKPQNIIVLDAGQGDRVKVLDFGVAKLVDDTRAVLDERTLTCVDYNVFGSPRYIAPESVLGHPIDPRTDIYSVGAVLFELLAGCPPFDDDDPMVMLRHHASTKAPTLAERAPDRTFTPELEYLVAEALAKRPERRFSSATDMISTLDATRASLESPRGDTMIGAVAPIAMRMVPVASDSARTLIDVGMASPARARSQDPRRRRIALAGGAFAAIIAIAAAVGSGAKPAIASDAKPAATKPLVHDDATAFVEEGHRNYERGRFLAAVTAYERAIVRAPQLANDTQIRTNVRLIARGNDAAAAIVALELLAARLNARQDITKLASQGKVPELRRRAFAIAERDGFAEAIDRVESYILDLKDAKACDDRRVAIEKLRVLSDQRAIAPIRQAHDRFPCVTREATDALASLEARS